MKRLESGFEPRFLKFQMPCYIYLMRQAYWLFFNRFTRTAVSTDTLHPRPLFTHILLSIPIGHCSDSRFIISYQDLPKSHAKLQPIFHRDRSKTQMRSSHCCSEGINSSLVCITRPCKSGLANLIYYAFQLPELFAVPSAAPVCAFNFVPPCLHFSSFLCLCCSNLPHSKWPMLSIFPDPGQVYLPSRYTGC